MSPWTKIIIFIICLIVSIVGAAGYKNYLANNQEMIRVSVPARDIPPYTMIYPNDVEWKKVLKGAEEDGAVRSPNEAVGMMANCTLYQGEQIKRKRLLEPSEIRAKQVLAVNIDVNRGLGGTVQAGDMVDAWWIPPDTPIQTPGQGWLQVGHDAIVLDVRDSAGKSVMGTVVSNSLVTVPAPASPPAIVVLAVRQTDVSNLVGAALPRIQNIVLVKKYAPDSAVSSVPVVSSTESVRANRL